MPAQFGSSGHQWQGKDFKAWMNRNERWLRQLDARIRALGGGVAADAPDADGAPIGLPTAMTSTSSGAITPATITNVTGWGPNTQYDPAIAQYWYSGTPGGGGSQGQAGVPGLVWMSVGGIYLVTARVGMAGGAGDGRKNTRILKNPGNVMRENSVGVAANTSSVIEATAILDLDVGDSLQVQVWQNTGANLNLWSTHYWEFVRLAPLAAPAARDLSALPVGADTDFVAPAPGDPDPGGP